MNVICYKCELSATCRRIEGGVSELSSLLFRDTLVGDFFQGALASVHFVTWVSCASGAW